SFSPGFYLQGNGRDLGYLVEFRSSAELAYRFDDYSRLSLGIAHLSNASLGGEGPGLLLPTAPARNPGVETLTLSYSMPIDRGPDSSDKSKPSCCTGVYATAVLTGGGAFLRNIKNKGATQGTLKDDSAQDSVAGGGLAIGYNWRRHGAPIRTEIEYDHMVRFDYDSRPAFKGKLQTAGFSDNLNTTTVLLNAYYDFDVGYSWWRPFAGFGVGYARNHSDNAWNDFSIAPGGDTKRLEQSNTHNLAWALAAGASVDLSDTWFTEAGYRFLDVGKAENTFTPAGFKVEAERFYRHELRLGIGYRF
ncbi:MAG: porin family protein, partial [Alphaproteobacteria bacterium]|nr:porin family protein [Alphaproteobacteria bacterium]